MPGAPPAQVEVGGDLSAGDGPRVTLLRETFNTQTWRVTAPANGWLVVADVWYPGWQASVDGVRAPVLRADYLFRAVPVVPGEHTVTLRYHPRTFSLGLALSGLALAGWAFLYRRERK